MAGKLHVIAEIKKHPYWTSAAVFIGGAILIYLFYAGKKAPASSGGGTDNTGAILQSELQSDAIQAQQQTALQQASLAAGAQATQVQGAVTIAQDQGAVQIQQSADAVSLGTTESNNALAATENTNNDAAGVQIAGINAQTTQTSGLYSLLGNLFGGQQQIAALTASNQQLQSQVAGQASAFGNIAQVLGTADHGYQQDYEQLAQSIEAEAGAFHG